MTPVSIVASTPSTFQRATRMVRSRCNIAVKIDRSDGQAADLAVGSSAALRLGRCTEDQDVAPSGVASLNASFTPSRLAQVVSTHGGELVRVDAPVVDENVVERQLCCDVPGVAAVAAVHAPTAGRP